METRNEDRVMNIRISSPLSNVWATRLFFSNPTTECITGISPKFIIPHFDLYATTYPEAVDKAKRAGHRNVVLTQWAANAQNLEEPLTADACRWDVSFIGSAYGNRKKWISSLNERGIQVSCFGYGWENGPVAAEMIPTIVRQSKISLNFGDSGWALKGFVPYRSRQIKARVFEV